MKVQTGHAIAKYAEFLEEKDLRFRGAGLDVPDGELLDALYPFQRYMVRWALARGRAAIFADCGLGKTLMQLEWSRQLIERGEAKRVLILTPLAVAEQTCEEAVRFGITGVRHCVTSADAIEPICITNYEKFHHFDRGDFDAIVLDESSILKAFDGKTRRALTDFAAAMPYRLACTATPAPNDLIELSNHAEFLGVMTGKEMLALFFRQDGNTTHAWRLKGHAERNFWKWLASWSIAARSPRDLGFEQEGYDLPRLVWHEHALDGWAPSGYLFPVAVVGLDERRIARRETLEDRVAKVAEIVNAEPNEQWLVWCELNAESEALTRALDAVEVKGSDSEKHKRETLLGFAHGSVRRIVSKPSICGHGMNWQGCARMVFVGLSDSYEALYQAVRRCWRFGQRRQVFAHVITTDAESSVVANMQRKQHAAETMMQELVRHLGEERRDGRPVEAEAVIASGDGWTLYCGDSVRELGRIESESVGFTVFSPPFPGMYAYTDSPADLGNSRDTDQLVAHFEYQIADLLRVTMPGRLCAIHLTQEPVFKRDAGEIGLRDFRGRMIAAMVAGGWTHFGEVTIDKNPQVKASRTKESTLLFKTLATDSAGCRPALADYMLVFRKPGDNPQPIRSGSHARYNASGGWITQDEWIEWAAPVWYRQTEGYPGGIRETDVLNVAEAREGDDQKHLCPLQLGVIERSIKLWSNPGDLVLSPFAGIGSEGYQAIRFSRRFVGIELKRSYFETARRNLGRAETLREQGMLFAAALPKAETA